jgi:site-specific recombinase XerD
VTTDVVIYGDGSAAPLLSAVDMCAVDVDGLVRHAARWLKDFTSAGTMAAYARDLGLPYLVHHFGLDPVVTDLAVRLDNPHLLRAMAGRRPSSRTAAADLCWFVACVRGGIDPITGVTGEHVRVWVSALHHRRHPGGRDALDTDAKARRVSTASSFYKWAVWEELIDDNPVDRLNRKRAGLHVDRHHSNTLGISPEQMDLLVHAADHYPGPTRARTAAVIALMCTIGCRVAELAALDVADYRVDSGQRVVDLTRKGGKRQRVPVPPVAAARIDAYLDSRSDIGRDVVLASRGGTGRPGLSVPLFITESYQGHPGGGRLDRAEVRHLLQRVAARQPELATVAHHLHPHVLRHSVATRLLAANVPLHRVQELFGHVDPATTQRYNRAVDLLVDSPAHDSGRMMERGLAKLNNGRGQDARR